MADKVYKVTRADFNNLIIEASKTDLLVSDVPMEQLFDVMDFKEFRIRLRNWHGKITDFAEYVKRRCPK